MVVMKAAWTAQKTVAQTVALLADWMAAMKAENWAALLVAAMVEQSVEN